MKEIIMCKDCKFFRKLTTEESIKQDRDYECTAHVQNVPSPDDYCCSAEHKEDKEISQEETLDWLLRLVSSLDMLRVPQEWLEPIRKAIGTAIESVNISAELNKFMRGLWEEHCIEDITYTSGEFFDTITQEVYKEAKKTNETN